MLYFPSLSVVTGYGFVLGVSPHGLLASPPASHRQLWTSLIVLLLTTALIGIERSGHWLVALKVSSAISPLRFSR
jgi:hypothetical protein